MKRKIRKRLNKIIKKLSRMPSLHKVIAIFSCILSAFFIVLTITILLAPPYKAKVEYIKAPNADIAYYVRGKGEPLILIPGFGMTMQHWDPSVIETLAKDYTVIVFDYRGVGASSGSVGDITENQMTEDIITLMDQLKLDKAHIVGWSLGSFVAQNVAEKKPDRVDKLVLIATAPGGEEAVSAPQVVKDKVEINLEGSWEDVFVPMMFLDKQKAEAYKERLAEAQKKKEVPQGKEETTEAKGAQQVAFGVTGPEKARYENLKDIKAQTLLISGDKDTFTPLENAQKVKKQIPNAKLEIIKNAGHAVLFEEPEKTTKYIEDFLKS